MLRKFVALGLVGLFLAMSLVVAQDNIGPYDRAADVNRDGIVDIMDLTQVGQAYGSNYTLRSQANTTVITVVSFAMSPPEIENARVAIFSNAHWDIYGGGYPKGVSYTNASGIAIFELSPNSSYKALAWRTIPEDNSSSFSYTDFETNSFGEASAIVVLGEPAVPSLQLLPARSLVITLLNKTNGLLCDSYNYYHVIIYRTWYDGYSWQVRETWNAYCNTISAIHAGYEDGLLGSGPGGFTILVKYASQTIGSSAFQLTTEDLSANVIICVPSSP